MILFSPAAFSGLYAVPAASGPVREVTKLDPAEHETTHRWPEFLPDGKHFLFLTRHSGAGAGVHPAIEVGSLDGGESKHLLEAGSNVKYVPGYILFVREHALMAQKFDDKKLQVSGDPIILTDDVKMDERFTRAVFSVSQTGLLAYQSGSAHNQYDLRVVARSDPEMRQAKALRDAAEYFNGGDPNVSPDGKNALAAIVDLRSGESDMWRIDLTNGDRERLTNGGDVYTAAWSPDGKQFAYMSWSESKDLTQRRIMVQSTSGSGAAQELLRIQYTDLPEIASWTPDGKNILYMSIPYRQGKDNEVWSVPVGGGKPALLFKDPAYYSTPIASPDGHFLAYVSDETGRDEVYVTPYPSLARRWQISQSGGSEPRWRRDGKELFFFASDNRLQAVPLKISGSDFAVGQPQPMFSSSRKGVGIWRYDVLPDGQHFVLATAKESSSSNITLVTNWTNLLAGK